MKKYIVLSFLMVFSLCFSFGQNKVVKDFKLWNVDGKYISLSDYKSAKGFIIIFTCNHCPFAKLYPPRFNELHSKFSPKGVPLIAISSTDTVQYEEDTYPLMVEKAKNDAEKILANTKDFQERSAALATLRRTEVDFKLLSRRSRRPQTQSIPNQE